MIYSQRVSVIKRASEKMFLKFEQREIDFLSILEWDDLMNHLEIRYGQSFQDIFAELLVGVLKDRKENEELEQ